MEYKVKERFFEKVLEIKKETNAIGQDIDALRRYVSSHINTDDDSIKFIFAGYLDSLEEGAEMVSVDLDMTYDTINNLIPAIIALANIQHKSENYKDDRHNAEITMKTLAAYLTLMAVNNHGIKISVNRKGSSRGERPDLWSDRYYLRINNKRESDFLPYAIEGIDATPVEVEDGFTVDINPLIGAYLRITGVNLADHGFANLIITFNDQSEDEEAVQ